MNYLFYGCNQISDSIGGCMNAITYLIYIIFWELFTLGGSAYVVFVLERSNWWMFLGIILGGCAYKPGMWIHAKKWKEC